MFFFPSWLGSEEERIAVETASHYGSKHNIYLRPVDNDVTFKVALKDSEVWIGEDAQLIITVKNLSSEIRSCVFHCRAVAVYYTGVQKAMVKKEDITVKLKPWQGEKLSGNTETYCCAKVIEAKKVKRFVNAQNLCFDSW